MAENLLRNQTLDGQWLMEMLQGLPHRHHLVMTVNRWLIVMDTTTIADLLVPAECLPLIFDILFIF